MTNSAISPEGAEPSLPDVTADTIRRLADLVEENGLSELLYEAGDVRIVLRTAAFRPATMPLLQPVVGAMGPVADAGLFTEETLEEESVDTGQDDARVRRVEAPIMGVFYRAQSPGADPLVEVGDVLAEGQVIGLIEAMKVFSEVPTPVAGRIIDIPVKNGTLVQPGDPLMVLEVE